MDRPFRRRALFVIGVSLFFVLLLLLAWRIRDVLLIAFLCFVLAVFLRTCVHGVQRLTRLPDGWALALTAFLLVSLGVLGGWLVVPGIVEESSALIDEFPEVLEGVRERLEGLPGSQRLLEQLPMTSGDLSGEEMASIFTQAREALSLTVTGLTNLVVIVSVSFFLAAEPRLYRQGLLKLMPAPARPKVREVMLESSHVLREWLLGQLIAMVFVGVLCWLGLTLIGVPQALVLGLLAGLLNFIPMIGAFLSAAPAVLLALSNSLGQALWVVGLYVVVQQLEGNLIQPIVQKRAAAIPPALLVLALIAMAQLFGLLGLLIAAPFTAVLMVLFKRIYVEEILGDDPEIRTQ